MSNNMLYVMVGLPSAGKSTIAKCIAEQEDAMVVSSDKVRERLYGSEKIQGNPATVFHHVHSDIYSVLREGKSVIMDATNLNSKRRIAFLRGIYQEFPDLETRCVLVLCNPAELEERDAARERHVGPEVIYKMLHQFQPPHYYEGWTAIDFYYTSEIDVDMSSLLLNAIGYDQKNHHHSLTLGSHLDAAVNALENPNHLLEVATSIHDIGKMFCQTIDENGEGHYYDHQNIGSYIWLCSDMAREWFERKEWSKILYVANLIAWHMTPYQTMNDEAFRQWANKRGMPEIMANDILALHRADMEAH